MYGLNSIYYEEHLLFHGSVSHLMGTRFDMLVSRLLKEDTDRLWADICRRALDLERMLNRFDPESEVYAYNSGKHAQSRELERLIGVCEDYTARTKGYFDITKGTAGTDSVKLDFGGFAKGFLLREIKERLSEAEAGCALVDFGQSSFMAAGRHPSGGPWKVAVRSPFDGTTSEEIELEDKSLSVSGNSPGYIGHIVNPFTGEKMVGRRMVAVISDDPLDAEVLSTALSLTSCDEAEEILSGFPGVEVKYY